MTTANRSGRAARPAVGIVLLGLLALAGCGGPPTADVSGTVTVAGKAPGVEGLTISFVGDDGRPVTAAVAPDGTYRVAGAPVGEVRIGFGLARADAPAEDTDGIDKPLPGEPPEEFEKRQSDPKTVEARTRREKGDAKGKAPALVPERYLDPLKSGVTTTLRPGSGNTFDVDIK